MSAGSSTGFDVRVFDNRQASMKPFVALRFYVKSFVVWASR